MKLCFDSVEELRAFAKNELKGTPRRGKGDGDDENAQEVAKAPAPIMPPGNSGFATVNAPAGSFTAMGAFPSALNPEVTALTQRIVTKLDGAIASGQPADAALNWFRGQCGPEASGATMEQIKTVFLPRMTVPALESIAKLMGA